MGALNPRGCALCAGSPTTDVEMGRSPASIGDGKVPGDPHEGVPGDFNVDGEVDFPSTVPTPSARRTTAVSLDTTVPYRPTGCAAGSSTSVIQPVRVCLCIVHLRLYQSYRSNWTNPDSFLCPKVLRYYNLRSFSRLRALPRAARQHRPASTVGSSPVQVATNRYEFISSYKGL